MKITSSAFRHNKEIPSKYTCDADNINPDLSFSEIPEGAKSLVLIHHDPDAPAAVIATISIFTPSIPHLI